jgi:hypothetical protein
VGTVPGQIRMLCLVRKINSAAALTVAGHGAASLLPPLALTCARHHNCGARALQGCLARRCPVSPDKHTGQARRGNVSGAVKACQKSI